MNQTGTVLQRKVARQPELASNTESTARLVRAAEAACQKGFVAALAVTSAGLVLSSEIGQPADLLADAAEPGLFGILASDLATSAGFLVADAALVTAIVEIMTGGDRPRSGPDRPCLVTPVEASLCRRVLEDVLAAFSEAIQKYGNVPGLANCRLRRLDCLPGKLAAQSPEEPHMALRLSVDVGQHGRQGTCSLGLPLRLLSGGEKAGYGSRSRPDAENAAWERHMLRAAEEFPADLACILARVPTTLARIRQFRTGDVIDLPQARMPEVSMEIRSSAGGRQIVSRGELGTLAGRKAFQQAIATDNNDRRPIANLPGSETASLLVGVEQS